MQTHDYGTLIKENTENYKRIVEAREVEEIQQRIDLAESERKLKQMKVDPMNSFRVIGTENVKD